MQRGRILVLCQGKLQSDVEFLNQSNWRLQGHWDMLSFATGGSLAAKKYRRFFLTSSSTILLVYLIHQCEKCIINNFLTGQGSKCLILGRVEDTNIGSFSPHRDFEKRLHAMEQFCRQQPSRGEGNVTLITNQDGTLEYCHVPKAASTLWMKAFAALNSDGTDGDIHKHMLRNYAKVEKGGGEEGDKVRFLFVRHPFHRLASAYHDKFTTHADPPFVRPVADYKV